MQKELRQALQNLQGIFDEGFMTQAEYNLRRKKIIDGATAVSEAAADDASAPARASKPSAGKAKTAVVTQPTPKSVFERLGGSAATAQAGKWGHDGFKQMYGSAAAKTTAAGKATAKRQGIALYQAPGSRSAIKKTTGDLREKLVGTGRDNSAQRKLPAKCPW